MFQMRLLFCVPCYIGRGSGGCPPPQGRGRRRWISFSGDPSWSSRSSSSWSPQQSWRGFQVAVSAPAIVAKAGVFNFIIAQTFNLNLHFHIRAVNTSVQASELRRLENVVLLCCNVEEICRRWCCMLTGTDGSQITRVTSLRNTGMEAKCQSKEYQQLDNSSQAAGFTWRKIVQIPWHECEFVRWIVFVIKQRSARTSNIHLSTSSVLITELYG